jgi:ribonuclease HII
LAGPVVACAVILPRDRLIEGATDSKALSRARREELAVAIREGAAVVSLGAASVREIDRLNILRATTLAMRRALDRLPMAPEHIVVDGLPVKGLGHAHEAVVGGDGLVHCISCASIVAKVVRDDLMVRLARRYPGFGWASNAGYGTARHREAVLERGPTPHHRLTFLGLQYDLGV